MRLNQVMNQIRGLSYNKKDVSNNQVNGKIPVLRAGNIQDTRVVYEDIVFVPKEIIKEKQFLQYGDILIAASSGSISIVGKAAMFRDNFDITFGAFCKVLRPDKSKIDFEYFKHFFETDYYKRTIKSLAEGANINNLKTEHFDELEIPLPPLEQQKKIAAILDAADAYRQKTKALITKYDELTQSLFLDMFGDPVSNNLNFPFPKIKEFTNVSQGMQIAIKDRHIKNGPNRYKYLTVAYLNGRKDEEYIENPRASVICNKDEILMIRTGNTGQVVTDVEGVFHNNFFKIDWDKKKLNKNYLVHFLSNPGIRRDLLKRASTTTIPDLSHGQFYDLNIIVPPIELQNQFAKRIQAIETQKAQAQASLEKAEELFNSLLKRAFKGELV